MNEWESRVFVGEKQERENAFENKSNFNNKYFLDILFFIKKYKRKRIIK